MSEQEQPQSSGVLGEVAHLRAMVDQISASLRSQREVLKKRGIRLPPMTMQAMQSVGAELAKLENELVSEQTELGQLRSLADNAAMINTSLDIEQVLTSAMDVIINLTGAERGFIILVDADSGALDFRVVVDNEIGRRSENSGDPQISQTVVREVLEAGQALLTDNAYKDERLQGNVSIAAMSLRSVLCVPLIYKGTTLGVIYTDNRLRAGVFEAREKNLLVAFANQVAVALENARLYTALQHSLAQITAVKELTDNVFESIGSGVITTDSQDLVLTFNRAASDILKRHDRDSVIGQALRHILTGFGEAIATTLEAVRITGERQVVDATLDVEGHGQVLLNMKFSPLRDAQARRHGVAMIMDDLTEQQERSEMLKVMRRYLPPEMVDNIHTISSLALGGERREVTCMYVDVLPNSVLPADIPPKELMALVNVYLSRATTCINDLNGVIDKYMGNEIMVLFNTQLNPQRNHAERAVETALLIRDEFIKLYAELGIAPDPHYYRVGINTGVATLGNVGSLNRRDFTAIGDTINLTKRLEENATQGQIIISETCLTHLENRTDAPLLMRFEEREPIQVKGRQQHTRRFEVFKD